MFGTRALLDILWGRPVDPNENNTVLPPGNPPGQIDPPAIGVRARGARAACVVVSDVDSDGGQDSPAQRVFCASPDSCEIGQGSADHDELAPAPAPFARPSVPSRAGFGKTGRVNATRRDPEFEQTEVYAGEDIEAADKAFAKIQEDICGPTHKLIPDGLGVRERKDGSTCKGYLCAFKNRVNGGCGWRMRRLVDNEGVIKIQSSRPAHQSSSSS
jgi:hypothetical protein